MAAPKVTVDVGQLMFGQTVTVSSDVLRQFAAKVTRQRGVVSQAEVAAFKAAGYDNRAVLDVLVLAATKLISNYTNHLAETPNDSFMKGAEWTPPGKLKPAA